MGAGCVTEPNRMAIGEFFTGWTSNRGEIANRRELSQPFVSFSPSSHRPRLLSP